jgi:hypothetical protein
MFTGGLCCFSRPGWALPLSGSTTGFLSWDDMYPVWTLVALRASICFAKIEVADTLRLGVVNLALISLDTGLLLPPLASPHHQGFATYAATAFVNWVVSFGILAAGRGSWEAWL